VCALDGSTLCCPETAANLAVYRRGGGNHGGTGYPVVRLLALVACGTRTIIDATFGADQTGETGYARDLLGVMRRGMIVLADRNFGTTPMVTAVAGTGADLLFRITLSWEESVRLDLRYVENWSMALDPTISWKTVGAVLKGRGAY
jgi:hypothetical protein